jgi:hypothetical protein
MSTVILAIILVMLLIIDVYTLSTQGFSMYDTIRYAVHLTLLLLLILSGV